MKVSLDLDGTFWGNHHFFTEMALGLQSRGHEVGILTARPSKNKRTSRRELPFLPSFFLSKRNTRLTSSEWKAEQLLLHSIDVHFDDEIIESDKYIINVKAPWK